MGHSCPKYRLGVASLTPERDSDFGYFPVDINSNHFSFRMSPLDLDREYGCPTAEIGYPTVSLDTGQLHQVRRNLL